MQVINNRWLIPIVVLSSDRLFSFGMEIKATSHGEYRKVLIEAVLDYQNLTGNLLRNEDVDSAIDHWFDSQLGSPVLFSLRKIAKEFLVWQGDCFEVQSSMLQEWLSLITYIDPAWIIAIAFQESFKDKITLDGVSALVGNQCHLALPKNQKKSSFSDNHVHLSGHGSSTLSLLGFAVYFNRRPLKKVHWPRRSEHLLFEAGVLDKCALPVWINMLSKQDFSIDPPIIKNYELLKIGPHSLIQYPSQSLMHYVFDENNEETKRWIVFCIDALNSSLRKIRSSPIDQLIQCSNILRSYMLVAGVGLGQFVEHFGFAHRKPAGGSGLNYVKHSLFNDLYDQNRREFRVSPGVIIKNDKLKPKQLFNMASVLATHGKAEHTHFIVHFSRGFPSGSDNNDRALIGFRSDLVKSVRNFQQFFESGTYAEITDHGQKKAFDIRKVVRGFDVAGNENQLPIEVFAPSLRVLRSGFINPIEPYAGYMRKPFLTVHAGEDYSHILSGLRAIDEAVEFCQMEEGDRIGHALALGVDVRDWAIRQQTVYISLSDQLDNLVWLYHQAVSICLIVERFNACLALIQQKIARYSNKVYGESISPEVLYQSWLFRRNEPNENLILEYMEGFRWRPDQKTIETDRSGANKIWQAYLNRSLESRENCDLVIAIEFESDVPSPWSQKDQVEVIREIELELYSAVQDFLLEKYSEKGLVLEACPTSNITIGRFTAYKEHPIYRWNSPVDSWLQDGECFNRFGIRKGPVAVCINTDDAGLMPTNLENEHRLLEVTAIQDLNVSPLLAENWINSIRLKGNQVFENNHLDWEVSSDH